MPLKREPLAGKKTYLAALAMAAFAISGVLLGYLEPSEAFERLLEAAAIISLRLAVKKGV